MDTVTNPKDLGVFKENVDPADHQVRVVVRDESLPVGTRWRPVLVLERDAALRLARELSLINGRGDVGFVLPTMIITGVIASTEIPGTWWGWICRCLSWFMASLAISGIGRR